MRFLATRCSFPFPALSSESDPGYAMAPGHSRLAASDYGICRLFAFTPRSRERKELVANRDLKVRFANSIQNISAFRPS